MICVTTPIYSQDSKWCIKLCAYLCPADCPFGGFLAIYPLMQNWWDSQTERKADLAPGRAQGLVTDPQWAAWKHSSDPAWGCDRRLASGHEAVTSCQETGLWRPVATPVDRSLLAAGPRRWVFNPRGFSLHPVGFPSDSQPEAGDNKETLNFSEFYFKSLVIFTQIFWLHPLWNFHCRN